MGLVYYYVIHTNFQKNSGKKKNKKSLSPYFLKPWHNF